LKLIFVTSDSPTAGIRFSYEFVIKKIKYYTYYSWLGRTARPQAPS